MMSWKKGRRPKKGVDDDLKKGVDGQPVGERAAHAVRRDLPVPHVLLIIKFDICAILGVVLRYLTATV
jgi:hypothetical protein